MHPLPVSGPVGGYDSLKILLGIREHTHVLFKYITAQVLSFLRWQPDSRRHVRVHVLAMSVSVSMS